MLGLLAWSLLAPSAIAAEKPDPIVTNAAQIIFHGTFPQARAEEKEPALIYSVRSESRVLVGLKDSQQTDDLDLKLVQGRMKELVLSVGGAGDVTAVQGKGVASWGLRRNARGVRSLVVIPEEAQQTNTTWNLKVSSVFKFPGRLSYTYSPLILAPTNAALFDGLLTVDSVPAVEVKVLSSKGLVPVRTADPGPVTAQGKANPPPAPPVAASTNALHFRFSGEPYAITLRATEADPDLRVVRFLDFNLAGEVQGEVAAFTLTGTVQARHPEGGWLELLSGAVALTDYTVSTNHHVELLQGRYRLRVTTNGTFPLELRFHALITRKDRLNELSFTVVPAALRPVTLRGLPKDTQVKFLGAAEARQQAGTFTSHLPAAGPLQFQWQAAREEVEGKLFYAVTGTGQITVSPGLVRQMTLLEFKVMQGELREAIVALHGEGEITRVDGRDLLTWKPETVNGARRLRVQFNQAQKGEFELTVHTQTPLGAFPLQLRPLRLAPVDAIRYGGHLRVVNDGAVRLEVLSAPGLAQISPQRFPVIKGWPAVAAQQQSFAFRFSGAEFGLEVRADNILPELSVSQVLVYHLGETETQIDTELEVDIREAPLREFTLTVPDGYGVAQLNAPSLSDYSLKAGAGAAPAELKLQFGQPLIGRQVINLRLTKNHATPPATWDLPPVRPVKTKSLRGFIGVTADAGWRLGEGPTDGLTEIATAFFPKQIKDLQLAFRLREDAWTAAVKSERLAQSVQADTLHIFSLGEGVAYGSTLVNYLIAGAPVNVLRLEAATNYGNVEFVGKEIRSWTRSTNGAVVRHEVNLHTPMSGTYSLVASYDVQFKAAGDVVPFTGLRPVEVQAEQGYVVVVSAQQFKTEPAQVSPGLIPLESGEIPVEYRLLFDAPILAAYQFSARPFDASLKLTSLAQSGTVNQVADRAIFRTHVSSEGSVATDARYLLKSKGHSHVRLTVPAEATLWSARVDGREVVPVIDQRATLIPLPQNTPPNQIITLDLKLAAKSAKPGSVSLALPVLDAPVLLADWQVAPDAGHALRYAGGSLRPRTSAADDSGFAWLARFLEGAFGEEWLLLWVSLAALLIGGVVWRWVTATGNHRFSAKNCLGLLLGVGGCGLALFIVGCVAVFAARNPLHASPTLEFMIPVQAAGGAVSVAVANVELDSLKATWLSAWPLLLALVIWGWAVLRDSALQRQAGVAAGWTCLFWGCLRRPNGADEFFWVVIAFALVHIVLPLVLRQGQLPRAPRKQPEPPADPSAGAVTALLVLGLFAANSVTAAPLTVIPQAITQQATVKEERVFVSAKLRWESAPGRTLDFLRQPAVLTRVTLPKDAIKLGQSAAGKQEVYQLIGQKTGTFEVSFEYEIALEKRQTLVGFPLATHFGLVNQLTLQLDRADVEIATTGAMSAAPLPRDPGNTNVLSRFELALAPNVETFVAWKPRGRDTRAEQTVFYADLHQLFLPAAGIVEGVHLVQLRPAQGQMSELVLTTPEGMTITDVIAPALATWRFDPDQRKVRLHFSAAQTQPFAVRVDSQFTTGQLPFEQSLGVISVDGAAGQIGLVGVATGTEVQLADAQPTGLTPINIEDFPGALVQQEVKRVAGLTLRRAFRYADSGAMLRLSAIEVQPDVRVVSNQTLSLGEDRTVLAANLDVSITRAGVFKLSFALPAGMDVEALTGPALSHWTELQSGDERVITLHLQGRTEGRQQFAVNLIGPGPAATNTWPAPRLTVREAGKETGQLVVVPEQGMRLHLATREAVTQLDPKRAGINQRGALAFRLLHGGWRLAFQIEKVNPWIQVATLQDVTVREGQLKLSATLDYQIENAGVKSLFVRLPANAEGVRFTGEQVADAMKLAAGAGQPDEWEIKLHRRIIGAYRLQVAWQQSSTNGAPDVVRGLETTRLNLQRGHLTLRTSGRLQINLGQLPAALQATDWQSVPANLRQGVTGEANFTYRVIEPAFTLPLNVVRHDAAKLLPARVQRTGLATIIAESGMMLTSVKLTLQTGDKRLLRFTVPAGARFWFAFVNRSSVRPWREGDQVLLPLEQNAKPGDSSVVEFLYSLPGPSNGRAGGDLGLRGPGFDLPLEDVSWQVFLPPSWRLDEWKTKLQLLSERGEVVPVNLDLQAYLQHESQQAAEQTSQAEGMLQLGNRLLNEGRQQQAREAYRNAYTLSQHDNAFNEDARVQLNKLKTQQALVGLNYRRNSFANEQAGAAVQKGNAGLEILASTTEPNFTQQQVRQALGENSVEDNTVLMRLAEHLVKRQEAAVGRPEAIQATVPGHGTRYTFTRSLQVDPWADLSINLETSIPSRGTWRNRVGTLAGLFVLALVLMQLARRRAV